jgi:mannose-6-phosphate isomerase
MNRLNSELTEQQNRLKDWLFNDALPLWAKGIDRVHGGFYERIHQDGRFDDINRRTRVAARQVYAYALAKRMGFAGDVDGVVDAGLDWLRDPACGPDGLLYGVLSPTAKVVKAQFDFYDHAFALLAYASAFRIRPHDTALKDTAETMRDHMMTAYAHPVRGFEEAVPRTLPLKANPHMHFFEACLAWIEAGGDEKWLGAAHMIAELFIDKFLNPKTGALHEFFDADWNISPDERGRILEPGHQFEWAWLVLRFSQITKDTKFIPYCLRLIEVGERYGTDPKRGVTFNEMWDDYSPKDFKARLWPQTERIKAYALLLTIESDLKPPLAQETLCSASKSMRAYLDTPIKGLWYDCMDEDGKLITESAPASSLYHIICAIDELGKIR